jgi:hypothetical protein
MSQAIARMTAELNAVRVTIDDLLLASREVHKLPPEDRDWEGRLHLMVRLFQSEPDKARAVEYRLIAVTKLLESGVLPHWVLPTAADGAVQIAEPVWATAATAPLLLGEHDPYFDPQSFTERVLALAEPDGNA